jgi:hypothetical protein
MNATDMSRLAKLDRGELVIETDLTYDGITPVLIRVTKREGRFEFSDDGGAVAAAGVDHKRFAFADRIATGSFSVNVSRQGVVSLPGFARSSDEWLTKLPMLVTDGSLALYEALLELEH